MANFLTEADVERSLLEQFRELGYDTASGPEIAPGGERSERKTWADVVLRDRLRSALVRINAHLPAGAVEEALRKVGRLESPSLVLFSFNEILVATDGLEARAGTLTADWDRFMPWRTRPRRRGTGGSGWSGTRKGAARACRWSLRRQDRAGSCDGQP